MYKLYTKQELILLALHGQRLNYAEIISIIKFRSRGKYNFGSELRPLVRHMVKVGLIEAEYGRIRHTYKVNMHKKYYKITERGIAAILRTH